MLSLISEFVGLAEIPMEEINWNNTKKKKKHQSC